MCRSIISVLFIVFSLNASAESNWAVENAKREGFLGCEKLISQEVSMEDYQGIEASYFSDSRHYSLIVVNGASTEERLKNMADVSASRLSIIDFFKYNNACYATKRTITVYKDNCEMVRKEYEKMGLVAQSVFSDIVVAKRKGTRAKAFFKPIGGYCEVTLSLGQIQQK